MLKRSNSYQLTLEQITLVNQIEIEKAPISFEFENHDEIFTLVKQLQVKDPFKDEKQAAEFVIGLKLFTEVMIKNRSHPLFAEFFGEVQIFMKKLKAL
jgi:hypothetical protein